MLTRKDYEAIVKAFSAAYRVGRSYRLDGGQTLAVAAGHLCVHLHMDNPRFDGEKFINACFEEDEA